MGGIKVQLQTFVDPKSHESADGGKCTVQLGSNPARASVLCLMVNGSKIHSYFNITDGSRFNRADNLSH